MGVYFIGCLHFGHKNMAIHRGFVDEVEHDEYLIKQWNKTVNKKEKVFILGDITMEKSHSYYQLDRLNGIKHVIGGNHDMGQHTKMMLPYIDKFSGVVDYKGYILTHVPIHPNEVHFYRGNIHAHIHHVNKLEEVIVHDSYRDQDSKLAPTLGKYINVDAKLLNFKPISFEEIENLSSNTNYPIKY
jgi:calcineurin-like phosphoesterase family protein